MQLVIGILCLLLSIGLNSLFKWSVTEWTASPLPHPGAALLLSGEYNGLASDYFLVKAALFYGKHNRINFYKISAYTLKLKLIVFGRRLLLKCHTSFLNLETNSFIPPIAEKP